MTIKEFAGLAGLKEYTKGIGLDRVITGGYVSDLLSDVMGNAHEGEVWITLQSHVNVAAIASLKEVGAVVLVKGITPGDQMLARAMENGIPVLGSDASTFEVAGKLYNALNK